MSTLRAVCKCFIHAHQKLEKPKHQHQPSNSWWMDKKNCGRTHTWNTISTHSKKKGHMTDMCNIMGKSRMPSLRERNQTQKALYVMISFLWHSVRGKKTTYIHVLTKHIGESWGKGDIDYKEAREDVLGWWKCSLSWSWWWFCNHMCLWKFIKFYA